MPKELRTDLEPFEFEINKFDNLKIKMDEIKKVANIDNPNVSSAVSK
jgi:hypothetical protein